MAKKAAVKEKYAGPKGSMGMEVKMPPLSKEVKPDIDHLGNKLADFSERVNELELSIESMRLDIKRVMNRMGL